MIASSGAPISWRADQTTISVDFSEIKIKPRIMWTIGRVWNLSFGSVLNDPIRFNLQITVPDFECELAVQLSNDEQSFQAERELGQRHSSSAKQELGYNPYSSSMTGSILIEYPDHPNQVSYMLNETAKDILYRDIAYFLSFAQRRRILFSNLHLDPSSGLMTFPTFASAEYLDAVAFGVPAIPPSKLKLAISCYLKWRSASTLQSRKELLGVIVRMNNLLNLPYAYERAEGYWRIIEAIGTNLPDTAASEALYENAKAEIGMKGNSSTLKKAARTAALAGFSDAASIAEAFNFRNDITHEYIDFDLIGQNSADTVMNFLSGVCEVWIGNAIGFPTNVLQVTGSSVIFGRVI